MSRRPVIVAGRAEDAPEWGFPPRGMRRDMAARYVGISPSQFDTWVTEGLMPPPKQYGSVVVWDRLKLDAAFEALPDRLKKPAEQPPKPVQGLSLVETINAQRGPGQRCPTI